MSPKEPRPRSNLMPTIRDVARNAGVSVGTVSKALNDKGQLSADTRSRVQAAATALGFLPNDLAQSLHRKRSFTIGLISSDLSGRFSIPILEGIEEALDLERFSVFLCKPTDDAAHERRHVESLLAKRVDGIIVTSRRTDPRRPLEMPNRAVPVVYAYARTGAADATCLLPDDEGGGLAAGRHLLTLGRTRIAHITGPDRFAAARERQAGLQKALMEAGRSLDPRLARSGPWSEAWGREALLDLLQAGHAFDAVFCGSDQIARGVADALREQGRHVPDDVALVGYDNWEIMAAATRPPLTTVDPCLYELGRGAAQCLLSMIADTVVSDLARRTVHVPSRLVIRASCGSQIHSQAAD